MAERVCPWWLGYVLINPLRRLGHNPRAILSPHVRPGMVALDVGCAMGFFSLEMARLVGTEGKVVCVDLQQRMIDSMVRRASKAGLLDRIDHRVCYRRDLALQDYDSRIDFALAFAVVHEVRDADRLLRQLHAAMKPNGRFLLAEPQGHVSSKRFQKTETEATNAGFEPVDRPKIWRSRTVLLEKR